MNEDEVRRIVREEIAEWERDRLAEMAARSDQNMAAFEERQREWREKLEPDPSDGPAAALVKRAMRGDE